MFLGPIYHSCIPEASVMCVHMERLSCLRLGRRNVWMMDKSEMLLQENKSSCSSLVRREMFVVL